jgi:hypothetical protein
MRNNVPNITNTADDLEEHKEEIAKYIGGLPTGIKSSKKVDLMVNHSMDENFNNSVGNLNTENDQPTNE